MAQSFKFSATAKLSGLYIALLCPDLGRMNLAYALSTISISRYHNIHGWEIMVINLSLLCLLCGDASQLIFADAIHIDSQNAVQVI